MTTYSQKLFKGEKPTDQDWNEHLLDYHKHQAGVSENMFGRYPTNLGKTSYELLADVYNRVDTASPFVLDLACGNGPLTRLLLKKTKLPKKIFAVDMSRDELALARNTISSPHVDFLCETAQKLPVPAASIDLALCHMSLMLMQPLEPVVQEISRVLNPGCIFAAVITDPAGFDGMLKDFFGIFVKHAQKIIPNIHTLHTSDPRFGSIEGIRSLFNHTTGFEDEIESKQFVQILHDTPLTLWNQLKTLYLCDLLTDTTKEEIKKDALQLFAQKVDTNGKASVGLGMRLFIAKKI